MHLPTSFCFHSLVSLLSLPAWGAAVDLPSTWLVAPPAETGGRVAWEGIVLPLGDTPLSAAVRNDHDFLYVRVRTSDASARRQILFLGLTVWADVPGKSKEGMGLRFPKGGLTVAEEPGGPRRRGLPDEPGANADEMQVIGPGRDDRRWVPAAGHGGAWARLELDGDLLTLDMALPLRRTAARPLAVEALPGSTVAIGFETEKPAFPVGGKGRPGGFPPGAMGGGGGMPGAEGRPSIPRPVSVRARVTLALEPSARR